MVGAVMGDDRNNWVILESMDKQSIFRTARYYMRGIFCFIQCWASWGGWGDDCFGARRNVST
jgi:hypothetical protein